MKGRSLSLLGVFAGKANLSELAERSGRWRVLFAQDKLYGLDLLNPVHMEMMKDVIRTQEPEVATLAQPCGPWSSWQRMRKSGGSIYPFGNLCFGAFQTARGALAVLEQPKQSEALNTRPMEAREVVHEKTVDLCQLGLKDRIPGVPHKKSTVVQMCHPVIETPAFSEKRCSCAPRAHQPIEGSVALTDPVTGTWRSVKRSALASEWTHNFVAGYWMDCNVLWMRLRSLTRTSTSRSNNCTVAIHPTGFLKRYQWRLKPHQKDSFDNTCRSTTTVRATTTSTLTPRRPCSTRQCGPRWHIFMSPWDMCRTISSSACCR